MTELTAGAVPVTTDNAAPANAAAPSNGSEVAKTDAWWSGLQDEGNRKTVENKGWKAPDDAIKSYVELEKRNTELSTKALTALQRPADDAKAEEWGAFWSKIGRPDKPEGYDFPLPEGLPENLQWDGELDTASKQWFFEEGATAKQAAGLRGRLAQYQAAQFVKMQEASKVAIAAAEEASTTALEKEWGTKDSKTFQENHLFAKRYVLNNGGDAKLAEWTAKGWMGPNGSITDPIIARAFAYAGRQYVEEGGQPLATGGQVQAKRSTAETLFPPEKDIFGNRT